MREVAGASSAEFSAPRPLSLRASAPFWQARRKEATEEGTSSPPAAKSECRYARSKPRKNGDAMLEPASRLRPQVLEVLVRLLEV
ncbi:hypothetical protein CSOJ01_05145 [Colletotrichum sojae]|uniref:Uncharacterized protein n=1 Tax=Colletotrichum sojae TaxID=2175907 RepID=A0A8H6JG16_9PEZI|nr:hypothetical protein CSOJ01_05145 [Colletotrichum sojae]